MRMSQNTPSETSQGALLMLSKLAYQLQNTLHVHSHPIDIGGLISSLDLDSRDACY